MKNIIANCKGFQWDEVFLNLPFIIAPDTTHSQKEHRYYALGRTDINRWLFIAFTIRDELIRVISARDMNRKETRKYAARIERYTKF